jgi:hypothetical protein
MFHEKHTLINKKHTLVNQTELCLAKSLIHLQELAIGRKNKKAV